MKRFVSFAFVLLAVVFAAAPVFAQFKINDLLQVRRVGDPQVSPDGRWVAYTVGEVNKDANRTLTQIYVVSIDGGEPKRLTNGERSSSSPRWSPDGRHIAYVSGGQVWIMNAEGHNDRKVTDISSEADNPVWAPDGKWIAFVSMVYPECEDDACNRHKDEAAERSKVKAHVTTRLLYRHWVEWRDRKRSHVFVVSSDGGVARDMTPGDFDSPPYGAQGPTDYAFSPDSRELAYLRNPDPIEAISTNSDVYLVPLGGNPAQDAHDITASNRGYDASPQYSADGRYVAYRSQATEGFEADRWRLMVYDRQTKQSREVPKGFDLQVDEFTFSADSGTIYFTATERGLEPIYKVAVSGGPAQKVLGGMFAGGVNVAGTGSGQTLVFASSSIAQPPEIYRAGTDGNGVSALTHVNDTYMAPFNLRKAESMEWIGAVNTKIQGFIIKPANFDPSKKYPMLVIIHGGPQSAFDDSWGYRWNPQIFANAGYVVFMPNPRGSPGYGQKFVDEISGDWGGKAYVDIMNGVAKASNLPYVDKTRIGAAGASYGGYMVDWILGHNTDPRFKFKALVSHAGVYNLESMAGSTEELWFVNWEFKGFPWQNPLLYNRWSPNKFAANFKTPTLVTCGDIDFRVPYDQSLQLYTALQLNHTDSKLIIFPDEGHWILKPQDSEFWYNNVLDWFAKYLHP